MKKLLIIFTLLISASVCYAQSNVIRRHKPKTEQKQDKTSQQREAEAKKKQQKAEAKRRQNAQRYMNVKTFTVNGVSFDMVRVDGGSFMMGADSVNSNEQPVHSERVDNFHIGKTEVTQDLWVAVMGSNPSYFKGGNRPVENVSWDDCQEFVERLSRLTGRIFRLPTEAEWEYAARGGNRSHNYTYSGSNDLNSVGWYDENSQSTTHPVAQKLDNELGLYDMSGNVWEWTSDNLSNNLMSYRVHRGGSWYGPASYCWIAFCCGNSPGNRSTYLGLRLAL